MDRVDVNELYYITPIANVPSILQQGILSNRLASRLAHRSVAMPEIQALRTNKRIPGAGHLHDYANLYFDAHNPALSKLRNKNNEICILRVSPSMLDLRDVIISDGNAATGWARFYPVAPGLPAIDKDSLFARYWTHPNDPYSEKRHKSLKCAEVLIPDKVEPRWILGAYVANQPALAAFAELRTALTVTMRGDIFF